MSTDRSTKELFSEALEQPVGEREAFLERACAGDADLRAKINRLLDAHGGGGTFLAARAKGPEPVWAGPAREKPGDAVGPYKLLQEIGEGGFGVVFMAEQKTPVVRRVALKILKAGMDTRQVIARFEAERQALAMMDHSGIARVFDAGATAVGRPYFVMELVRGEPITSFCDTQQMDLRRRLELFQQVCHAVQHAHQKGIIHRDLKPSNILVAEIDGHATPKIIDFGIAKATGSAGGTATQLTDKTIFTDFRHFIGTPEYMSPEQAGMGAIDVDTRSDIYSLGVLLYELLTGAPPFDPEKLRSAEWDEMRRIIREEEPERPSTRLHSLQATREVAAQRRTEPARLIGSIRGDLDWIVMKCLEKDRSRRYETASGLAMDIERHLNGEPVLAAPPSTVYRVGKFVRRNRARVLAGSLVALSLMGAVAGTTTFAVREARQRALTDRIARFQGQLLKDIKAPAMAARLREDLLNEAEIGWQRMYPKEEKENADRRKRLEALLDATNFTNAATRSLDWSIFRPALATLDKDFSDEPRTRAKILQDIADTLRGLSILDSAMEAQSEALTIRTEMLGKQDPDTVRSQDGMARVLVEQGRWAEAVPHARDALDGTRRIFGDARPETWEATYLLAGAIGRTDRPDQSEPILRELFDRQSSTLGENDRWTLETKYRLGYEIFRAEGIRLDEGIRLIELSAPRLRTLLGEDHETALVAMGTLGVCREYKGRLSESEQILGEVLPVMHRALGDDSWKTWYYTMKRGGALVEQGRSADAEPLVEEALRGLRRTRVNGDYFPLFGLEALSQLRILQGRSREAEVATREALEGWEGWELRESGQANLNGTKGYLKLRLARALDMTGGADKVAEADRLRAEYLDWYKGRIGADDPRTIARLGWAAWNLYLSGRASDPDAERWAGESVEGFRIPAVREASKRYSYTDMMDAVNTLATILRDTGRPDEALPLYEEIRRARGAIGGVKHLLAIETWVRHAECLRMLGRFAAAEEELSQCMAALAAAGHQTTPLPVIRALIKVYDDWHAAAPGKGHDAKAEEWRDRLPSWAGEAEPWVDAREGG